MCNANMCQYAPYPEELAALVQAWKYRPGWRFSLGHLERDPANSHGVSAGGLTMVIFADVHDSYHPEIRRPVNHYFIVPAATYDREAWRDWVQDCIEQVEMHESREWSEVDGERPYAPNHGPGKDPYRRVQYSTDEARRTSFRGVVQS